MKISNDGDHFETWNKDWGLNVLLNLFIFYGWLIGVCTLKNI